MAYSKIGCSGDAVASQGCGSLSPHHLHCPQGPFHSKTNCFHICYMAIAVRMSFANMKITRAQKMEPPPLFQSLLWENMEALLRRLPGSLPHSLIKSASHAHLLVTSKGSPPERKRSKLEQNQYSGNKKDIRSGVLGEAGES